MAVDIARQTVGHKASKHGQTTVGTSAVRITPDRTYDAARGILLKAAGSGDSTPNSVPLFVGYEGVTTTDGFPLAPGEALHLPIIDPSALFAIGTAADQELFWFVL